MTDQEKEARGRQIAKILQLKRAKDYPERYCTEWGTKTALGIYNTVERLIIDTN